MLVLERRRTYVTIGPGEGIFSASASTVPMNGAVRLRGSCGMESTAGVSLSERSSLWLLVKRTGART